LKNKENHPVLETILIIVALLVPEIVIVIIYLQPNDYRVARSETIDAPQAGVFPHVNDLRKMNAWSPWLEGDPQVKQTYDGPAEGKGAIYAWNGNNKVGEGRMTIVDTHPYDTIRIKLDFLRPFKSTADVEFTFKAQGDQTVVTWAMNGKKIFITKLFGLIMSMDKMIGGNFEKGLAKLKKIVETKQQSPA
jgi:hypothetical protein